MLETYPGEIDYLGRLGTDVATTALLAGAGKVAGRVASALDDTATSIWRNFKNGNNVSIPNTGTVPGSVQSRINVANGPTKSTPLRDSGRPVSSGFERHVLEEHFYRPLANNRSIFSISTDELKTTLQRPDIVKSPATAIAGGGNMLDWWIQDQSLAKQV